MPSRENIRDEAIKLAKCSLNSCLDTVNANGIDESGRLQILHSIQCYQMTIDALEKIDVNAC